MTRRASAAQAMAGLALLVWFSSACTVNIELDPSAGLDSIGGSSDVLDEAFASALDPDLSGDDPLAAAEEAIDEILAAAGGLDGAGTGRGSSVDAADAGPEPSSESPLILVMPPPAGAAPPEDPPSPTGTAPAVTPSPAEASPAADSDTATPSEPSDTTPPGTSDTDMIPVDELDELEPPPPEDLPGEPYEYGPEAGASLAVVGVDHDDVLNVRDVPFGEIIATLGLANPIAFLLEVRAVPSDEPIAWFDSWDGAVVATGRTRKLPTTVWHEVQAAGVTGWASGAYLAPIGLTDDITAQLIDRLGGRPVAATLTDLALLVGEVFASEEPPSRVVVTVGPGIFEGLGEVTVDVLNLGDDSLRGYRLYISATPGAEDWMSEDPGPFTLRTAARTIICHSHRGVTPDGLCV